MSNSTAFPTTAKSLVEFTANKSGELAVTDTFDAEGGALTHADTRDYIEFTVQYEGFWFAIHADQQGTKTVLRVHGIVGHLPFTYQSNFARTNILAVVSEASRAIKGQVRVDENQRIILIDTVTVEGALTPKVILAETAKVLLRLKPYLELVTLFQLPKGYVVPTPVDELAMIQEAQEGKA